MSDEHSIHGRIETCKWSYDRVLDKDGVSTIIFAKVTLTGASVDIPSPPKRVAFATIRFGNPTGSAIGKIVEQPDAYHLSVTLPLADLPSFVAAVQGPKPLLDAVVTEGDSSVGRFRVISDGF